MVASTRAESPLYQQQESPPDLPGSSPETSQTGPTASAAAYPAIDTAFGAPAVQAAAAGTADDLEGDHSKERELDVAIDIRDPSNDAAPQNLAPSASMDPNTAPVRPSFWKDPFGWVLRPRAISKHQRIVLIIFGRVGWCAKAIIYSIIGGLCCKSSVQGREGSASASPQGAFILIGNNDVGVGLLILLAVMLALYAGWRFWEGIVGAGTDADVGKAKNFFRYRLSPVVSGGVYLAYMAYILSLLAKNRQQRLDADDNQSFPNSWRSSDAGKFGLVIIGIAFIAAFAAQIEMIVTPAFHREMRPNLPPFIRWLAIVAGHIGFTGRAGTFLLVAILFFRTVGEDTGNETTIANALYQLQGNAGGRFALFLLGWGLIVYGLYATMCGLYIREFPTQPRSRNPIEPLQHARHAWNKRRERKLQARAAMMRETLGLEMNGGGAVAKPGENGHAVNGHAEPGNTNGSMTGAPDGWAPNSDGPASPQATAALPQHNVPDAALPPSRVYVPPSSVAQV